MVYGMVWYGMHLRRNNIIILYIKISFVLLLVSYTFPAHLFQHMKKNIFAVESTVLRNRVDDWNIVMVYKKFLSVQIPHLPDCIKIYVFCYKKLLWQGFKQK